MVILKKIYTKFPSLERYAINQLHSGKTDFDDIKVASHNEEDFIVISDTSYPLNSDPIPSNIEEDKKDITPPDQPATDQPISDQPVTEVEPTQEKTEEEVESEEPEAEKPSEEKPKEKNLGLRDQKRKMIQKLKKNLVNLVRNLRRLRRNSMRLKNLLQESLGRKNQILIHRILSCLILPKL